MIPPCWVGIENYFLTNPNLGRLYKQMYPDNTTIQALSDPVITPEVEAQEVHMCQILFETMDLVDTFAQIRGLTWKTPELEGWLAAFRSWFTSDIVQQQWVLSRQYYGTNAQQFVNRYLLQPGLGYPIMGVPPPAVVKSIA